MLSHPPSPPLHCSSLRQKSPVKSPLHPVSQKYLLFPRKPSVPSLPPTVYAMTPLPPKVLNWSHCQDSWSTNCSLGQQEHLRQQAGRLGSPSAPCRLVMGQIGLQEHYWQSRPPERLGATKGTCRKVFQNLGSWEACEQSPVSPIATNCGFSV